MSAEQVAPFRVSEEKRVRLVEAYLLMAKRAKYRPAAPSDGFGNIQLTLDQCRDVERLQLEGLKYAVAFNEEEDSRSFHIGCSHFPTNRAFVFVIEAARLLCSGEGGETYALKLLQMATEEIKAAQREKQR